MITQGEPGENPHRCSQNMQTPPVRRPGDRTRKPFSFSSGYRDLQALREKCQHEKTSAFLVDDCSFLPASLPPWHVPSLRSITFLHQFQLLLSASGLCHSPRLHRPIIFHFPLCLFPVSSTQIRFSPRQKKKMLIFYRGVHPSLQICSCFYMFDSLYT